MALMLLLASPSMSAESARTSLSWPLENRTLATPISVVPA
jgi:hypothetical protein